MMDVQSKAGYINKEDSKMKRDVKRKVRGLYDNYPRRYDKSSKIVYEKSKFIQLVNRDNKNKDVYVSVYHYTNLREVGNDYKLDSDSAVVDKVFMDSDFKDWYNLEQDKLNTFKENIKQRVKGLKLSIRERKIVRKVLKKTDLDDNESKLLIGLFKKCFAKRAEKRLFNRVIIKLENYLRKQNLLRVWAFSGGGFHLYLYVNNRPKHKKSFLKSVYSWLNDLVLEEEEYYIDEDNRKRKRMIWDPHCPPKLSQLARVINTYNTKRKSYCISLTEQDLDGGLEHIKRKATKPQTKIHYLGSNLMEFDAHFEEKVESYDSCSVTINLDKIKECNGLRQTLHNLGILWNEIPLCIKNLLGNGRNLNYIERYVLITFLYRAGLTRDDIVQVLSIVLNAKKLFHCCGERKENYVPTARERVRIENQPREIIKNDYYISCSMIRDYGLCHKLCKIKDVLYYFS